MDIFSTVTGGLQTSGKIITFCVKLRHFLKSTDNVSHSAMIVERTSRRFRENAVLVYEALLEAAVNPDFDVHPDLENTFRDANAALDITHKLVTKWAHRMGLRWLHDEAKKEVKDLMSVSRTVLPADVEMTPFPSLSDLARSPVLLSDTPPKDEEKQEDEKLTGRSTKSTGSKPSKDAKRVLERTPRNPFTIAKSGWFRLNYVAYGAKEIESSLNTLLHERTNLSVMTNKLPFQFSKKLKIVEKSIEDAWKEAAKDDLPKVCDPITSGKIITDSYDTSYKVTNDAAKIIVERKANDSATSIPWIVTMLGSIDKNGLREVGLLHCAGYAKRDDGAGRTRDGVDMLIFDVPEPTPNVMPRSLRARISDRELPLPSLSERIRIAQTLVASVVTLHSLGIVHRSLSPEGILLFPVRGEPKNLLGDLYLLGLGQARDAKGGSGAMVRDNDFRATLYTHPQILTIPRTCKFEMKHDIFSLGVCLLEIALWEPLFEYLKHSSPKCQKRKTHEIDDDDLVFDESGTYGEIDDKKVEGQMYATQPNVWGKGIEPSRYHVAMERRDILVEIAKTRLPPLAGKLLCDAIVACLEIDMRQLSKKANRDAAVAGTNPLPTPEGSSTSSSGRSTPSSAATDHSSSPLISPKKSQTPAAKKTKRKPPKETSEDLLAKAKIEMEYTDRFMMKLLEMKQLSGSSGQTIMIARDILKSLERINL
ncbi:hypothetical protein SCHPADRAFT_24621 [Schizopora paradoxa]|uniref:Protein kinase domain-containing protein n=1 Tax=Schizopora paradoxa TaxID=27342 RepID=A0A0H2SE65_9AGAM|nr:hypothetical protein SCHPADRAFT_24621 [Schizopora paradoxa]